eukprot:CAMPEP_0174254532 /NCGR_PEP_ID=MMETSP0439-20130205/3846_1 /TAXON_ID=0 /ORGANISM="Stereomyxa ramosa, Strain Chinc5" /LENGTH=425 /DNA_ID=CAMNT_0015336167 /DNA_START=63 /DNA_END=1340 /DNA_ORIENTATION=-
MNPQFGMKRDPSDGLDENGMPCDDKQEVDTVDLPLLVHNESSKRMRAEMENDVQNGVDSGIEQPEQKRLKASSDDLFIKSEDKKNLSDDSHNAEQQLQELQNNQELQLQELNAQDLNLQNHIQQDSLPNHMHLLQNNLGLSSQTQLQQMHSLANAQLEQNQLHQHQHQHQQHQQINMHALNAQIPFNQMHMQPSQQIHHQHIQQQLHRHHQQQLQQVQQQLQQQQLQQQQLQQQLQQQQHLAAIHHHQQLHLQTQSQLGVQQGSPQDTLQMLQSQGTQNQEAMQQLLQSSTQQLLLQQQGFPGQQAFYKAKANGNHLGEQRIGRMHDPDMLKDGSRKPKVNEGQRVDITYLLTLPQCQAAQRMNMSQATFSKRFREANNKRWPYRRLNVLEKQLKNAISEGDKASIVSIEDAKKALLAPAFIYKK